MSHTYDIVIINLPWSDLQVPYLAPAILKGIAESHGYTAKTIDFNVDLFNKFCEKKQDVYSQVNEYYMTYTNQKPEIIGQYYDYIIKELKKYKFRYLGISVFYILSQKATYELCLKLRKEMPDTKIVLGGKGLNVYSHISVQKYLEEKEKKISFDKIMANKNLADYFIIGDAEDAIIDLLSGKIDSDPSMLGTWFVPKKDNLEYPFANFDDYKLDEYVGTAKNQKVQLPVISSKGCVRRCDFCDVPSQFKKFQSKDGKRMAEEMLYLADKYKIYRFTLADSIANGNLKALLEFAKIMAEYNNQVDDEKKIRWSSNWIHRPIGQLTEEKFKTIVESGAEHFSVGAEHFSDHVLKEMNKKADMKGFMHELSLFRKYHIQCIVNNIIGHWAERYEDFKEHIDNLIRLGPYFSQDIITMMYMSLFYIMKNTPAAQNPEKTGLTMLEDDFSLSWHSSKNPNLTLKARLARHYYVISLCNYLNYPIELNSMHIKNYEHRAKEVLGQSMKLFEEKIDFDKFEPCKIFEELDDVEAYADKRIQDFFPTSELKIRFTANSCKGDPVFFVRINGEKIIEKSYEQGEHEIIVPFSYDYSNDNKIILGMKNKNKYDTIVDTAGKILQDKNIKINNLEIDGIDMLDYPDYFNNNAVCTRDDKRSETTAGFWHNGEMLLQFKAPFWRVLQEHKQKWLARNDKYQFQESLKQYRKFFSRLEF